jgi:integrase
MTGSPCATSSGPAKWVKTKHRGVSMRHANACPANAGRRCNCQPSYRAQVWDSARQRPVKSPTFPSSPRPRGGSSTSAGAIAPGRLRSGARPALQGPGRADPRRHGVRRHRHPRTAPSSARAPSPATARRSRPTSTPLGAAPASSSPSRTGSAGRPPRPRGAGDEHDQQRPQPGAHRLPLGVLAGARQRAARRQPDRRARAPRAQREEARPHRDPAEAEQLLSALPLEDRVPYALALYGGLRRKEIAHLTWDGVDLDAGVIRVVGHEGRHGRRAHHPARRAAPARAREEQAVRRRRRAGLVCPPRKRATAGRCPSTCCSSAHARLGGRRPRADRPARGAPHLRLVPHRRRRQREGGHHLHGPLVGRHHVRPLRPPVPRQRG